MRHRVPKHPIDQLARPTNPYGSAGRASAPDAAPRGRPWVRPPVTLTGPGPQFWRQNQTWFANLLERSLCQDGGAVVRCGRRRRRRRRRRPPRPLRPRRPSQCPRRRPRRRSERRLERRPERRRSGVHGPRRCTGRRAGRRAGRRLARRTRDYVLRAAAVQLVVDNTLDGVAALLAAAAIGAGHTVRIRRRGWRSSRRWPTVPGPAAPASATATARCTCSGRAIRTATLPPRSGWHCLR